MGDIIIGPLNPLKGFFSFLHEVREELSPFLPFGYVGHWEHVLHHETIVFPL